MLDIILIGQMLRNYSVWKKFANPSKVFDTITGDEKIDARAKSVTQTYDDLINYGYKWLLNPNSVDMKKLKEKLLLALVTVNILEGLRFYVSFACSFAFGELKLMEGSAKIISLIARDESQHLTVTQRIINLYRNQEKDKEMLQVIKENERKIETMYKEAIESEKRWATYLFSQGSMIGLSEKLLHNYVDYIAARRMKAIGIPVKNEIRQNPLPWTQHWLNSKGLQNAPQETEIESYVVGGVKQDVKKDTFVDFEL